LVHDKIKVSHVREFGSGQFFWQQRSCFMCV